MYRDNWGWVLFFFYSSNMMSNVFNRESTMKTERERIRGCWRLIKRWFVRFILWFQSFLNLLSLDSTNNLLLMLLLLLWWFIRVRKYFCVSVYVRVCTKNNYYFLTRPPPNHTSPRFITQFSWILVQRTILKSTPRKASLSVSCCHYSAFFEQEHKWI